MSRSKLDLQRGTAVITGAASGIGYALAQHAKSLEMNLVLADIDTEGLQNAKAQLDLPKGQIQLLTVDVSSEMDIKQLCELSFDSFGSVELLCNNAGVCLNRPVWEYTHADWDWVMNVNFYSITHAIRHFVPRMMQQHQPSHILNTASAAGLISTAGMAAYNASKHAVVTLSETLAKELMDCNAEIGVSVLCPAWIPTKIHESQRNRTDKFGAQSTPLNALAQQYEQQMARAVQSGKLSAQQVAEIAFEGVIKNQLHIIPHQKMKPFIESRMMNIINN
jgi:short-subunit dehydrogenase